MINQPSIQLFDPSTVDLDGSNLIEASAGTGKTYSIAILTLRLVLEKKIPIQQILMVTFTKAAVAELETRIRQFMRNALKVSQGSVINDETISAIVRSSMDDEAVGERETERLLKEAVLFLDETAILTIHSFCQRILTEFAFETSQVFGSEILTDTKAVITDKVNAFWRKYITTLHVGLLQELINAGIRRNNLVRLMENALSGKTITPGEPLPGDFLSVQNQLGLYEAISELEQRKEATRKQVENYIVSNIEVIRSATNKNSYTNKNFCDLLDDPGALLDAIIEKKDGANVKKVYPDILLEYEKIVSIEKEKEILLNTIINQLYNFAIRVIKNETDLYKEENNQLGFDDMIHKLHKAVVVENNEILINALQKKYAAAFIDEFQDTDKMQYEIFNRLFASHSILFYIGDPKQSIYAWRKADIFTYFKAAAGVANRFGMNTNYRSSNRFIKSMNQFFLPVPGFDTFYFSGESNAIDYIHVNPPDQSSKGELYKAGCPDIPITIFENPNNESIYQAVAAQIIQLLDSHDYTIEENGRKRKIHPSDIGILVRKNSQALELKELLATIGIPSVTINDARLLQSPEAVNLLYVLSAALDINASSINKALLSPLTGYDAAAILAMDDELALSRFRQYQYIWENEGVYVMLSKFIADYKVKEILLSAVSGNGERIITNTLQLMEVLHKTQMQKQFSSLELANWLKRGIEGMEVEGDEFEQRVESDEEAVKIVTIHKSKGLEYNIVFAPFLDLTAEPNAGFVTFRDAETGDYLFADKSSLDAEALTTTQRQLEQENRRLVYVALTRAVYKCYINKNTNSRFSQSSISSFINLLKENRQPLVSFETAPVLQRNYRYTASKQPLPTAYRQATNFELSEVNWRKLSYTWLDPGHVALHKKNAAKGLNEYDEFIFKFLKRGAYTGNLLHFIFERIDFSDDSKWEQVILAALKRFMANGTDEYVRGLKELLYHVTQTTIQVQGETFGLNELQRDKRINELEFDFNVARFEPALINDLSTPALPIQIRYAKELGGIMNGKMDMFFEHNGRYFILDWKSNFLGDSLSDYSAEKVQEAMAESNYHLQYLIYTLAVKKYLQLRVTGFDYEKHFGGVIYLFVRGIRQGREEGIFAYRPAKNLIDELDGLLSIKIERVE